MVGCCVIVKYNIHTERSLVKLYFNFISLLLIFILQPASGWDIVAKDPFGAQHPFHLDATLCTDQTTACHFIVWAGDRVRLRDIGWDKISPDIFSTGSLHGVVVHRIPSK
jgi:hypothetical protein